jgi:LCP family protein required for cell wall assembly
MDVVLPSGKETKINAAYSEGGPRESKQVIAKFLGIPTFDRYITLRINATKSLIDAIGGIDVPVGEYMDYDDNWGHLHIHFKPGLTHMNGDQAVSYSRFRHDACSDPCRIKRQQQVLRITVAKLKNDKFNDLVHIRQLIDVANRNIQTDLSAQEKLSLANHFSSVNLAGIKTEQVPYVADKMLPDEGDVIIADDDAKASLVKKLFLDAVAPLPAAPDARGVASVSPHRVRVAIQNGSGKSGLGNIAANRLRRRGFIVASVGNASSFDHEVTEIHVHSRSPYIGERVRRELSIADAQITPEAPLRGGADVTLIVGRDYEDELGGVYGSR